MEKLDITSTQLTKTIQQSTMDKTYTFHTEGKYVDKDIEVNINIPGIVLSNGQSF